MAATVWLAMAYVDGVTLSAWLKEERRGWREVLAVMSAAVGPHLLIADCYNANPGSMAAALRSLAGLRVGSRRGTRARASTTPWPRCGPASTPGRVPCW